jgi:hypothetical protein
MHRVLFLGAGSILGGGVVYFIQTKRNAAAPPSPSSALVIAHNPNAVGKPSPPHMVVTPAIGGTTILSPRHAELLRYGLPNTTQLQLKENYVSLVDYRLREPVWVGKLSGG